MKVTFSNIFKHSCTQTFLIYSGVLVVLIFLSLQYLFITHGFPTGGDPTIHIMIVKGQTFLGLLQSNYPIPESIHKFLYSHLNIWPPTLFVYLITAFLFFSGLASYFFITKATGSRFFGLLGASAFILGTFVVDGLRMGLLAEVFGWGMLIVALYFLAKGNIIFTLLFTGLLALSHPFSLLIYFLIFLIYFIVCQFNKDERKTALILGAIYLAVVLIGLWLSPSLIDKFKNFINPERIGWGERGLWEILINNDPKRAIEIIFAAIGVAVSIKDWRRPIIKISYILLFVSLFLSLNQIFGIRFLVFRFFPYLNLAIAIFTALGVKYCVESYKLKNYWRVLAVFVLSAVILWPQFRGNNLITQYQVETPSANDTLTKADQAALKWVENNLSETVICAADKRFLWLMAITDNHIVYDPKAFDETTTVLGARGYYYIYYSSIDHLPQAVANTYQAVYDKDGVKIIKI